MLDFGSNRERRRGIIIRYEGAHHEGRAQIYVASSMGCSAGTRRLPGCSGPAVCWGENYAGERLLYHAAGRCHGYRLEAFECRAAAQSTSYWSNTPGLVGWGGRGGRVDGRKAVEDAREEYRERRLAQAPRDVVSYSSISTRLPQRAIAVNRFREYHAFITRSAFRACGDALKLIVASSFPPASARRTAPATGSNLLLTAAFNFRRQPQHGDKQAIFAELSIR